MARKVVKITLNKSRRPIRGAHRSLKIKTQPLVHTFDDSKSEKGPAKAIRDLVEREIRKITQDASKNTLSKRKRLGIAGTKLFNATGRLASALFVAEGRNGHETRVSPDRLTGRTAELLPRLLELIKIAPRELLADKKVKAAIQAASRAIIEKGRLK